MDTIIFGALTAVCILVMGFIVTVCGVSTGSIIIGVIAVVIAVVVAACFIRLNGSDKVKRTVSKHNRIGHTSDEVVEADLHDLGDLLRLNEPLDH